MTPEMKKLLAEMEAYCADQQAAGRRMSVGYLAKLAVKDAALPTRLEAGGECLPRTMAKIRAYMAAHPPSPDEPREPSRGAPAPAARSEADRQAPAPEGDHLRRLERLAS